MSRHVVAAVPITHYACGLLAALSLVGFIAYGAAAHAYLDPERSLDDRLTTLFTPNRRATDFVGRGWEYQKLQWVAGICFVIFVICFGVSGG